MICVVEVKGAAGGIFVIRKSGLSTNQVEYDKNLIAIKVFDALYKWLMMGFYGLSYPAKKQKAWENLIALLNSC